MAKQTELTKLKKGTATFNLVGEAKVSEYTFKVDVESSKADSDWVYNHMNLGVDCGDFGVIYADIMSGYGTERQNSVTVNGKKKNDAGQMVDDFDNRFKVQWEDRFDKEVLATVGDRSFFTVGLVKGNDDKVEYKKFLSPYDGIKYAAEHLQNGMIVNVKGNLKYSIYNEELQVKKEITSIVLSKVERKDFKATFTQTVLLDGDAIGKLDRETMTIPITTFVVDFVKEHNGEVIKHIVKGKEKQGTNLPLIKTFDFKFNPEDEEKSKKMLKIFKVKGKKITQLTVDGYFTKGDLNTVSVAEVDIPDDIKELIELGYIDKEEVLGQIALKNGGKKPEKMVIKAPHIKFSGKDVKIPSVDKIEDAYTEDDVNVQLIIGSLDTVATPIKIEEDEKIDEDKALDDVLNNQDDEDDDWLNNL